MQVLIHSTKVIISRCCLAEDYKDLHVTRATHLFFLFPPVKSLICGIIVAIPIVNAEAPYWLMAESKMKVMMTMMAEVMIIMMMMIMPDNEGDDCDDSVEDHKNDHAYCHDRQGNRK